jgi:predicted O-methyltransferase YrrM
MARRARANFEEAGLGNLIEIKVADALLEVTTQGLIFDLIFLDIDKEDYVRVLPDCQRLLRNEGLLIADNVGFAGADGFNQAVNRSPGWRSVHMLSFLPGHSPERDGLCIALRV